MCQMETPMGKHMGMGMGMKHMGMMHKCVEARVAFRLLGTRCPGWR